MGTKIRPVLGKLAFQLSWCRWSKFCPNSSVWLDHTVWVKDYVDRKLLCVIIKSFVLETCVLLLDCDYTGWVFDFHFVLTSSWGLTWSLLGGWWCDCSASVWDRHLQLLVQMLFLLQPAGLYVFEQTVAATEETRSTSSNPLLPPALTRTAMGKKKHNRSKMFYVFFIP